MGFDLLGESPTRKVGEYFRNNVWWYRKLWLLVDHTCSDFLTEDDIQEGSINNGHLISKDKAKKMAEKLEDVLSKKKEYSQLLELMEREFIHITRIWIGSAGNDSGYPFSWSNVKAFARFCKYSGGFRIC